MFCAGSYPGFGTCVDGNGHYLVEVYAQSNDNSSYQVCATQKSGPGVGDPLQYAYVCGAGTPGEVNYNDLYGYATAHSHESFTQDMEGFFYL